MKVAVATRADNNNLPYFTQFSNSLKKFHPEFDLLLWDEDKIKEYKDEIWFYRASPIIGKEIINDYDLILLMDCDQIVMGNLDHIVNGNYDVGTVLNINRYDPAKYGIVTFQGLQPNEYYNNGLVAIRNNEKGRQFLDEWYRLCHSNYIGRMQYREQDILNILAHFGNYKVRCFDHYDTVNKIYTWNGLVAKGETMYAEMRGTDVVVPRGKDNYPDSDTIIKIIHWAGGRDEQKMNFRIHFQEPVIEYIEWLISDTDKPYEKA